MFLLILSTSTISGCFLHFNTSHVSINLKPYPWHHSTVFISIHLMFLLIQRWELYRHSKGGYFNTSHVSINHTGSIATTCVVRDFNTSHVSINLIHILPFWNAYRISIHLMFLLIAAAAPSDNTATVISIHLMFLLIRYPIRSRWIRNIYFNTSHVSINPSCNCGEYDRFYHFNTSHVSINPAIECTMCHPEVYFNTSHVSINPDQRAQQGCSSRYFNTSHVSINHRPDRSRDDRRCTFQYISCFY